MKVVDVDVSVAHKDEQGAVIRDDTALYQFYLTSYILKNYFYTFNFSFSDCDG